MQDSNLYSDDGKLKSLISIVAYGSRKQENGKINTITRHREVPRNKYCRVADWRRDRLELWV